MKASSVFLTLIALTLFYSCHSDAPVLGKAWRFSSYTDSIDTSKPPLPPSAIPLPLTANGEERLENYTLINKFVQRNKNNEETYIKFDGDYPVTDNGNFTQFTQAGEVILAGKLSYNFDNEEKKLILDYGNVSHSDEYIIKKVTNDSLILGFVHSGTFHYNVVFVSAK